jgi:dihydroorotase
VCWTELRQAHCKGAMMTQLLSQVRLLDPLTRMDQVVDVLIRDGMIEAIAPTLLEVPDETHSWDCAGFVLGPGLADLYSTVGEPGFESRETLRSIAEAAVAGGFTRLALLPGTQPVIDRPEQVAWMKAHFPTDLPIQMQVWGALTHNLDGAQLVELAELVHSGVCGLSDGKPLSNWMLLRRALEYLKPLQVPLALWPCDRTLSGQGVIREGLQAIQTGLPENPVIAETTALAALLEVVETLQTPVHIMRVSTARSVALLAAAKERGLPVTASVCWLHLLWNSEHLRSYDVNLRLDPPLGNPRDQEALIRGVETGVIDAIAIDHQGYTYEEKTLPFAEAPPGAIGLEIVLSALWEAFVKTQRWSALDLWEKLSTHPIQILGGIPTSIVIGQKANLTLFDPQQSWQVNAQSLKSLSMNTPYWKASLTGRVLKTWHRF